jgi:hypothetical protein
VVREGGRPEAGRPAEEELDVNTIPTTPTLNGDTMNPLIGLRACSRERPDRCGIIFNVPTAYVIAADGLSYLYVALLRDDNSIVEIDMSDLNLDDPTALRIRIARLTGTL